MSDHYGKKTALAVGILVVVNGISNICQPFIVNALLKRFNQQTATIAYGAIIFSGLFGSLLLLPTSINHSKRCLLLLHLVKIFGITFLL